MCVIDWCIQVLTNSVMRISNHIYMRGDLLFIIIIIIYLGGRGGGGPNSLTSKLPIRGG